ncbi:MAG: haloacid dehalogenase-like hydrolase [Armatimonadetes bacterium]|nr:haloacid dehalogenase-like hydrolase [Armatimonadota bacterium]
MIIGTDFDNTIVCYETLFHKTAVAAGLIPETTSANKGAVRDYLRQCGKEDAWTELQGTVYGLDIRDAHAFPGAPDFFKHCRDKGIEIHIISHKTRTPFLGPPYDLHETSYHWLESRGFFDPEGIALSGKRVHFELTREGKLRRIAEVGCTHFIDDLPEFLKDPLFPAGVRRILFDPAGQAPRDPCYFRASSWAQIGKFLEERAFLR